MKLVAVCNDDHATDGRVFLSQVAAQIRFRRTVDREIHQEGLYLSHPAEQRDEFRRRPL
jgi:hypothetical protein